MVDARSMSRVPAIDHEPASRTVPDAVDARRAGRPRGSDRFGYLVALGVNGAMLYVAHQLLEWGWPSFLTGEFDEVLPLITVSFVASMVTNGLFFWYDARWFKALAELATSTIGLVATLRLLSVFPFDFTRYDFEWSFVVRFVLIVVTIGAAIGIVVNAVKLLRSV